MHILQSLTFNEKLSLCLLAIFFPIYIIADIAIGPESVLTGEDFAFSFFWEIGWLIAAFCALFVSIGVIILKPDPHPSAFRMTAGRVLPLIALASGLYLGSLASSALADYRMRAFAEDHGSELTGHEPRAVVYRAGIPDGGVAIVRSTERNPETLEQGAMIDLTGERIKSCKRLNESDWACHFD